MNDRSESRRITNEAAVVFSLPNVSAKASDGDGLLTWVDGVLRIVAKVLTDFSFVRKQLYTFAGERRVHRVDKR